MNVLAQSRGTNAFRIKNAFRVAHRDTTTCTSCSYFDGFQYFFSYCHIKSLTCTKCEYKHVFITSVVNSQGFCQMVLVYHLTHVYFIEPLKSSDFFGWCINFFCQVTYWRTDASRRKDVFNEGLLTNLQQHRQSLKCEFWLCQNCQPSWIYSILDNI